MFWYRRHGCSQYEGRTGKASWKEHLKHGISVRITEDNKIRLNFHVIVAYGVNISTIADNLVSNVKYKVEAFTGMEIDKIDIYVEGVRAID